MPLSRNFVHSLQTFQGFVSWTKDGVKIVPGDEFYVTYEGSLVLKETDVDDSAEYTCVVKSKFGKDNTSSVVKIKGYCKQQ